MRVQLPMRRLVLFAAMLALAMIVFMPVRLVLGGADGLFSAREASGTVWWGRLQEARAGPAALGDLEARLAFLPLLTGSVQIDVERDSAAPDRFAGSLVIGRNRRSAESVTGIVPVEGAFGALPIAAIELTDVTVRFRDGTCEEAEGLVRASLTAQPGLPASLSGPARCDRGALLLPLTTGAGADGIALRLFGDGRWSAEVRVPNTPVGTIGGRL